MVIMKKIISLLLVLLATLIITACSSSRYNDKHDSTPTRLPNTAELTDAHPRAEPHSRGGNKNYTVRGINYSVLSSANDFEQTGIASWYGNKFHGHLTSNGEIYDMYAMSAAHKNLPLPSYVKVTNLINDKSVIVRVNDRGPFHQSRIIDLSYSAAYKLDMLKTGTAKVHISAITNFSIEDKAEAKYVPMGIETPYIQVFATSKETVAQDTATTLRQKYPQYSINTPNSNGVYRIQIGPIANLDSLNSLLSELKSTGYPKAFPRKSP
jgi:rare lipoprotein A